MLFKVGMVLVDGNQMFSTDPRLIEPLESLVQGPSGRNTAEHVFMSFS